MRYKITTECTAITDYTVVANTEEEAIKKFDDGEWEACLVTDYLDENIQIVIENS